LKVEEITGETITKLIGNLEVMIKDYKQSDVSLSEQPSLNGFNLFIFILAITGIIIGIVFGTKEGFCMNDDPRIFIVFFIIYLIYKSNY
jgi:hypothetical protein